MTAKAYRYPQIDGLRAILAWWVVMGHLVQAGDITPRHIPDGFEWISMAMHPVFVFMAISGFVIAHLIQEKKEPYFIYLFRRYFRLAPVMILGMVLIYICALSGEPLQFPKKKVITHVILHASLLHGVVPEDILYRASTSFIGPGWSISLEWQFYIIAPLLMLCTRNKIIAYATLAIFAALLTLGVMNDYHHFLGHEYRKPSLLIPVLPMFLFGGLLYKLTRFAGPQPGNGWPALLCVLAMGVLSPPYFSSYGGLITFFIAFLGYIAIWPNSMFALVFKLRPLVYLGKISYSTYLLHFPIILFANQKLTPDIHLWSRFLILAGICIPIIMLASVISYYFIERPGIRYAARISSKIMERNARASATA